MPCGKTTNIFLQIQGNVSVHLYISVQRLHFGATIVHRAITIRLYVWPMLEPSKGSGIAEGL
jgi:hypothetical protein